MCEGLTASGNGINRRDAKNAEKKTTDRIMTEMIPKDLGKPKIEDENRRDATSAEIETRNFWEVRSSN